MDQRGSLQLQIKKNKLLIILKQLADYVVNRKLTEIHLVADEYKQKNKNILSNRTINIRISILRAIASLAYKKWDWLPNPLGNKIIMLKEAEGRVPLISKEEVAAILDEIIDNKVRIAIKLAAYCGLRASEIQNLKPEHISGNKIWLNFDQKSGVAMETAYIPENINLRPDMFPIGISHGKISAHYRKALRTIGRQDLRFHDLRHAYGSWIVQNGNDLYMAGSLLRHKSTTSTKRYTHFQDSHKIAAVDKTFG